MQLLEIPIDRLVQDMPGATAVFHQYRLSFCCGGSHTLAEAIARAGIDGSEILLELEQLQARQQPEADWSEASDQALIAHILQRYHQVHREQLPELIRLAERVEGVHLDHIECPKGLALCLAQMKLELEQHMSKEENILFPMLNRGLRRSAAGPISVMLKEHDDHQQTIAWLKNSTSNFVYPEGACNSWRALYLGLRTLVSDLENHIALENNVLFTRQLESINHG
ncbi:iron-sulfur cluster repair protein YtfE [Teredinibacter haidensis]|uniref:iron-sulfur cluster repair protein YtfE n=1 Tax=Teredinibacter haidensis TaxID=2731755 RepID=UPI00163CE075|nr:iron-sulfur cluster repair protein YtfE [Teredinibacter haidensis]